MTVQPTQIQMIGTVFFALAILHTFFTNSILQWSHRFAEGSAVRAFLHLISEIEVVFGFWSGLFLVVYGCTEGLSAMVNHQESINFTEPLFVFCIMVMAATKPITLAVQKFMAWFSLGLSRVTRIPEAMCDYFVVLTLGPLSGSLITEPAAITVTALMLLHIAERGTKPFWYCLLGVLFVNVSIGGALTPFAAPPILMVAGPWKWDLAQVFGMFGWRSIAAVFINALIFLVAFRKEIMGQMLTLRGQTDDDRVPVYVTGVHSLFLLLLVLSSHYPNMAMGIFLFFMGFTTVTARYQAPLRLRESLLVAFFLGGIMVFGSFQAWWLEPLLASISDRSLYFAATALTAITDNAALTYLGAQVSGLSDSYKYYLVAGAISGGGLTLIANAPNVAGYSVLQSRFQGGFHPLSLLWGAIPFTAVAIFFLGIL